MTRTKRRPLPTHKIDPTNALVFGTVLGVVAFALLWATVNQYFEARFDWRAALTCLAAFAATIGVNVLRIGAMLEWPRHLPDIHHGWGSQVANWTTLILVTAICLYGARREIFRAR